VNASFYPDDLREAEAALLERRRRALARDRFDTRLSADELEALRRRHDEGKLIGLALSGGGLRSATFSLGFLQSLARARLLKQIDFLSTVSGGSYIGGFLGALFDRRVDLPAGAPGPTDGASKTATATAAAAAPPSPAVSQTVPMWDVEHELTDPRSRVVGWLRENGRYLSPAGASDGWAALAVILRNLLAVHMVLWTFGLTVFVALDALRGWLLTMVSGLLPWIPSVLARASGSGALWWSPALVLPALIFPLVLFPIGLAYWLVPEAARSDPKRRFGRGLERFIASVTNGVLLLASAGLILGAHLGRFPEAARAIGIVIGAETLLGFVVLVLAGTGRQARSRLSRWLATWLIVFFIVLAAGLVDSLGQTTYLVAIDPQARSTVVARFVAGIAGLMALSGVARQVIGLLGTDRITGHVGLPVRGLALIGAALLLLLALVGLSAIAHGIVWDWQSPGQRTGGLHEPEISGFWTWLVLLGGGGLCWFFGNTYAFLNGSSIASLYAARLTRAYLGASNRERVDDGQGRATTEMLESDFVDVRRYSPHEGGGPLHIINMTLNETVGGRSQIEERDRKGMNFALGPAGVSVAARHHALWKGAGAEPDPDPPTVRDHLQACATPGGQTGAAAGGFEVFPARDADGNVALFWPEMLDLGRWIAVSGAAASTALGSMTSLGLSLLCGLLNVRLGHWWHSGVDPQVRGKARSAAPGALRALALTFSRQFPVQAHLIQEFLARFPGTASRSWYLTDGGHFENTAVYELIRRRLKVIIVLDNGADPTTKLGDVAGLVRKARVDFETEIEFEDTPATGGEAIGSLAELGFTTGPQTAGGVRCYAALARILYPDGSRGKLLVVKAGVIGGDEPVDVLNYRAMNPTFPQQSTVDQFFDEAQWEAYRRLGTFIGDRLFDGTAGRALLAELLG
jgi:hypothetical protein